MFLNKWKYIWLPAILLIYVLYIAWQSRSVLLEDGDALRYFGTIAVEIVIIALLSVAIRRKFRLKQQRESEIKELNVKNKNSVKDDSSLP